MTEKWEQSISKLEILQIIQRANQGKITLAIKILSQPEFTLFITNV